VEKKKIIVEVARLRQARQQRLGRSRREVRRPETLREMEASLRGQSLPVEQVWLVTRIMGKRKPIERPIEQKERDDLCFIVVSNGGTSLSVSRECGHNGEDNDTATYKLIKVKVSAGGLPQISLCCPAKSWRDIKELIHFQAGEDGCLGPESAKSRLPGLFTKLFLAGILNDSDEFIEFSGHCYQFINGKYREIVL